MPMMVIDWSWDEAFDKFGFSDGDGPVLTHLVVDALEREGYTVEWDSWGCHNTVIFKILKDGVSLIPEGAKVGYDCPSSYLPTDVVEVLNREFGPVSGLMQDV